MLRNKFWHFIASWIGRPNRDLDILGIGPTSFLIVAGFECPGIYIWQQSGAFELWMDRFVFLSHIQFKIFIIQGCHPSKCFFFIILILIYLLPLHLLLT